MVLVSKDVIVVVVVRVGVLSGLEQPVDGSPVLRLAVNLDRNRRRGGGYFGSSGSGELDVDAVDGGSSFCGRRNTFVVTVRDQVGNSVGDRDDYERVVVFFGGGGLGSFGGDGSGRGEGGASCGWDAAAGNLTAGGNGSR